MNPSAPHPGTRRFPRVLIHLGNTYFSLPVLARRWHVTRQAASQWAKRHPEHAIRHGRHTYARDLRT